MEVHDPIIAYNKSKFTVEDLAMEKDSLEKHEFIRGEILSLREIYEGTKL